MKWRIIQFRQIMIDFTNYLRNDSKTGKSFYGSLWQFKSTDCGHNSKNNLLFNWDICTLLLSYISSDFNVGFFYFDFSNQHYSSQNLNGTMNTSSCSDSSFLASADCGSISSAGSAEAINSELEADDSQNIISQIASEKANNRKNSLSPKQVSPLR